MDFIGPVLEVLKCLWETSAHKIGYTRNLKENFENLSKEARKLHDRREDVNREIKASGKRPTSECKGWLDESEKIEKQWEEIEEEYREDKKCLRGWCPHLSSRMNMGRRALKLTEEVTVLTQTSEFKGGMVIDEPQPIIMEMPAPIIQAKTSTDRTLQEILRCIRDARIKIVGIWGMGGVGKTTIMKILNNHPEIAQTFEIVIWVTVSKEGSYKNVQNEVAQILSVKRDDCESDDIVRWKLFQALKSRNFLLLLDDVWNRIDLEQVGVPITYEDSSSKVVLSTRHRKVCHKMRTDEEIKVEVLSEDEAWALFRREVGQVVDFPEIKPFAEGVVKECCGLPLAIVVVGRALRKEDDFHVWNAALKELSSSEAFEIEDMEEEVFRRLKFSFDRLKHESTKNCFLYCALYPEDYEILKIKLIEYWRSEGLIDGWVTLSQAQDKGHMILKELMDASLLERCQTDDCVKMHDVIRDLALRITSATGEGCRSLVKAGVKLSEAPEVEEWVYARRISLMQTGLRSLPDMPNCPMLTTLLLQKNYTWKQIPSSFFEHMCALRVLDLSQTNIESLPPSLCSLVNLRGLYLDRCRCLRALPPQIGALTKLEVLRIKGKHMIYFLPAEFGELASLRCLQLNVWTPREQKQRKDIIPRGTMLRLTQLEQVSIYVNDNSSDYWGGCSRAVSKEMGVLNQLTCLDLHFADAEHLDHFIQESSSWKQGRLTSFRFFVGHYPSQVEGTSRFNWEDPNPKTVIFERRNGILICKGDDSIPHAMEAILNCTDAFLLEGHVAIQQLSELGVGSLNTLKDCAVVECERIETIINGDEIEDNVVLLNLEELHLRKLFNLRSIWKGPLPLGIRCFTSLRYLILYKCPKLRNTFPWGIIQQLSNLEWLCIKDCSAMKEIIANEEEEETCFVECVNVLPKLKWLHLSQMLELVHICSEWHSLASWPSLEEIRILKCSNLKTLPRGIINAPNLRNIRCEREWWEALSLEDNAIKQQLQHMLMF